MRFRIPGSTVAIAAATNSTYDQPLPWVRLWETNSLDGVYTVKVWNPVGTNQSSTWTVRVVSPIKAGSTVAWGNNANHQAEYPIDLTNTLAIAAGSLHSVAVKFDGSVVQWGYNWTNVPANLTNAIAVSAGNSHTLALRSDGTVLAWGTTNAAAITVPTNLSGVKAIASGWYHNVALTTNGTVVSWGSNLFGQTNAPTGLTNVAAIAAGQLHSVALVSNGTVVSWGDNTFGQTNVPSGLSNVVAVAAGGQHSLALKSNGTVACWGQNNHAQCTPPASLSNVMAIAAGMSHSVGLRNDGTVIGWGDNSNGQTNVPGLLNTVKMIAAGGDHTLAGVFSPLVQYPVDVTKDLLLIYNTTSTNSVWVKDYYLAHRPMVTGANVLGIGCTNLETFLPDEYTNVFATQVQTWLTNNPTKRPQYVVLFPEIPSRVNTNNTPGVYDYPNGFKPSVQYQLHSWCSPGWQPFVTSINMRGTNDCRAYIDKLERIGTNYSAGKLVISASAGGYGNTNFVLDNVRHGPGYYPPEPSYSAEGGTISNAITGIAAAGVPGLQITYLDGIETNGLPLPPHITNAVNVAGYISWGFHSSLGATYAVNGTNKWSGNSGWYIIETIESFNGYATNFISGTFVWWFASNAFSGTNYDYSNTPVGGLTYVDEPLLPGGGTASTSFRLWAGGKNLAICIWNSTTTSRIQVVGDPFVAR